MLRSGRADELSIRSASPRMVEGEAVAASLIGGVWDPSPKLRRGGWFLHRNAKLPRTLAETRVGTAIDSPACRPGSRERCLKPDPIAVTVSFRDQSSCTSGGLMLVGGGSSPAFSLRSAAASMSATATFGSEVVFAILSRAAACRAWKRFCNTITVVRDVYCISERTLIPFPSESTKVYKKRDTSELLPSI